MLLLLGIFILSQHGHDKRSKSSFYASKHMPFIHRTSMKMQRWIEVDNYDDDLRFYVLFNSISVISGRYLSDIEKLFAIEHMVTCCL